MTTLEFPLAQGWTRGLTIGFENAKESRSYDWSKSIHVKQTHSDKVVQVPSGFVPNGENSPLAEADGIVADGEWLKEKGYRLLVKTADCLPLLYIETQTKKVAAIHAGWRGLLKGIHLWPFEKSDFDPKKTWIWAGPSLNGNFFEVKEDMWSLFSPKVYQDESIFPVLNGSRSFHPWKMIEQDFKKINLELLYNVEVNTYEDRQWASYRRKCHDEKKQGKEIPYSQNLSWIGI